MRADAPLSAILERGDVILPFARTPFEGACIFLRKRKKYRGTAAEPRSYLKLGSNSSRPAKREKYFNLSAVSVTLLFDWIGIRKRISIPAKAVRVAISERLMPAADFVML